jgi:ABC-type antimicrobial peptide transport system permease subunit
MALGAQPRDVLKLVMGRGLRLVLLGLAIGLVLSFAATRFLSSLLYGVAAVDPFTFGTIPLLLVCVALAACFVPAHRATRLDPLVTLRND